VHGVRASVAGVCAELRERYPSVAIERVPWYEQALVIRGIARNVLVDDPLIESGCVYLQELASMLPALVLDPQPGERILDLCAAPGGKTLQLADLMEDTGEIVASDVSRTRLYKLRALLERYGVSSVEPRLGKGEFLWRTFADQFDGVLVDAPCSMGMERSARERKALARGQTFLLRSALACVRPGGRVVYATCTDAAEENEDVVAWILAHVPGVVQDPITGAAHEHGSVTPAGVVRIEKERRGPFFVAQFTRLLDE
jgi:16S rRNA (cytosine1407-C5)-methyltransferase